MNPIENESVTEYFGDRHEIRCEYRIKAVYRLVKES